MSKIRQFLRFMFTFPRSTGDIFPHAAAWSFVAIITLVSFVFATGSTFGQKCANKFEPHTAAYTDCVHRLSKGDHP